MRAQRATPSLLSEKWGVPRAGCCFTQTWVSGRCGHGGPRLSALEGHSGRELTGSPGASPRPPTLLPAQASSPQSSCGCCPSLRHSSTQDASCQGPSQRSQPLQLQGGRTVPSTGGAQLRGPQPDGGSLNHFPLPMVQHHPPPSNIRVPFSLLHTCDPDLLPRPHPRTAAPQNHSPQGEGPKPPLCP